MNLRELFDVEYRDEPELLLRPDRVAPDDFLAAMAPRERVNRWLGARRVLLRHALPAIARLAASPDRASARGLADPVTILDVGTATGDLPRALALACRRRRLRVRIRAIDLNRDLIEHARAHSEQFGEISYAVHDVFAQPGVPESFDLVLASQLLHHFAPERAVALLNLLGRLARHHVVATDLVRHPAALLAARLLGGWSRHPVFAHDVVVGVRRAFTIEEWADIARRTVLPGITVWPHVPCRVAITWERLVVTARPSLEDAADHLTPAAIPVVPAV